MALLDSIFSTLSTKSTPTSKRVVGIDIGSTSIKVVEVQERNSVLTLTTYGEIQLAPYDNKTVGEVVHLSAEKERQALVDVIRESAVKAKRAVYAMPLRSSFVTTMTLEADAKEDISGRVRIEARKYIPVQLNEVTLDWAEIETTNEVRKNARDVLLAAIENNSLERFKGLMTTVNLQNTPTEIECFSTIRALYNSGEKNSVVIDLGASTTKLYITSQGLLQRMHRASVGGVTVTKRLAETEEMSFEEAETLKRSVLRDDHARYADLQRVFRATYERPFQEFRRVIEQYEERSGDKIATVEIVGGGALFPNISRLGSDIIGREVIVGEPFDKLAYPAFMEDTLDDIGGVFATALGAALRVFE